MRILVLFSFILFTQTTSAQNLDSLINSTREKHKLPMVAVAAIRSDTILYMKAFGTRKLEDTKPNATIMDYMHIASNTKAMTGFIAAKLVEEGKIKWDTKFFNLFPQLKKKANPTFYEMTLQDLLTHRAKIPSYTKLEDLTSAAKVLQHVKGNASKKRKKFVEMVVQGKAAVPKEKNGTLYSNAGYSVAALMLEKITGKTWEKLIKEVFEKDLGMHIVFNWPEKINDQQPWGYSDSLQPITADKELNAMKFMEFIEPAGAVSTPFQDYVKFIQINLKGLQKEGQYLQKSTYNYLHFGLPGESVGWGNEGRMSNHSGSAGFFYTGAMLMPDKDIAYVVITNTGNGRGTFAVVNVLMKHFQYLSK